MLQLLLLDAHCALRISVVAASQHTLPMALS
jgi:hypothetical protein